MVLKEQKKRKRINNVIYRVSKNRQKSRERKYPELTRIFGRHTKKYKICTFLRETTSYFYNR